MVWLIVIISAYFLFGIATLGDKYLLKKSIPNPKIYAFYVGLLSLWALLLIPLGFVVPSLGQVAFSLFTGALFVLTLVVFYTILQRFEASRVVPAIGGFLPLFTFILSYIFSQGKEVLSLSSLGALGLLIAGSVLISWEKEKAITFKSLQGSALVGLLFALSFLATKIVYLSQPFLSGFILIRMGGVLIALCFLFSKSLRQEIFGGIEQYYQQIKAFFSEKKKISSDNSKTNEDSHKTVKLFLLFQLIGGAAAFLQQWAIFLAPLAYLAVINAIQGVQNVFLFVFVIFLSLKHPHILKEQIFSKTFFQKIIAIILICLGLALLAIFNSSI